MHIRPGPPIEFCLYPNGEHSPITDCEAFIDSLTQARYDGAIDDLTQPFAAEEMRQMVEAAVAGGELTPRQGDGLPMRATPPRGVMERFDGLYFEKKEFHAFASRKWLVPVGTESQCRGELAVATQVEQGHQPAFVRLTEMSKPWAAERGKDIGSMEGGLAQFFDAAQIPDGELWVQDVLGRVNGAIRPPSGAEVARHFLYRESIYGGAAEMLPLKTFDSVCVGAGWLAAECLRQGVPVPAFIGSLLPVSDETSSHNPNQRWAGGDGAADGALIEQTPQLPPPLRSPEVAQVFDRLNGWDAEQWKKALGDGRPKWLNDARVQKGSRSSKAPSTWNPVKLAMAIYEKTMSTQQDLVMARLDNVFKKNALKEWAATWDDQSRYLRG